jgi:hypothetical protein
MDWLPHIDLSAFHHFLLQAPAAEPKGAGTVEVELLKSQLEFLKADHGRLASEFAERMKQLTAQSESVDKEVEKYLARVFALTALATTLGAGLVGFFGWTTWKDIKATVKTIVERQLSLVVAETVDREIQLVRRSITREQVITKTSVDYFLKAGVEPAREIELIRARGFGQIRFCAQLGALRRDTADLVVVDLEHWKPDAVKHLAEDPNKEELAKNLVTELLGAVPRDTILVIYINGRINCLNQFPNNRVIMTGSEVSLIGNLADAAYIAATDRLP